MGDKGGKKDKEKGKKQKENKDQEQERARQDKQPKRALSKIVIISQGAIK